MTWKNADIGKTGDPERLLYVPALSRPAAKKHVENGGLQGQDTNTQFIPPISSLEP